MKTTAELLAHRINAEAAGDVDYHEGSLEVRSDVRFDITDSVIVIHERGQSWEWDELAWTASSITDGSEFSMMTHDVDETYDDFFLELIGDALVDAVSIEKERTPNSNFSDEDLPDPKSNSMAPQNNDSQAWYSHLVVPAKSSRISYAQVSFNPEPKVLLMLMEVNLPLDRTTGRVSIFDFDDRGRRNDKNGIGHPRHAGNRNDSCGKGMLTECSSVVSGNGGNGDGILAHNNARRYSDEPIIFADGGKVWNDESEMNVYLLHDSWDAGDMIVARKGSCSDTLRKLSKASLSCICLRRVGESKWRASERQAVTKERKLSHSECLAYSVLQNL
jgi:hypothetical protein